MTNIELYQKISLAAGEMDATPTDGQISDFVNRLNTYGIQIVSTKDQPFPLLQQALNAAAEKQDSDISIESYQDGSGSLSIDNLRYSMEIESFAELAAKLAYLAENVVDDDTDIDEVGEDAA